jgi:hypothetical protein
MALYRHAASQAGRHWEDVNDVSWLELDRRSKARRELLGGNVHHDPVAAGAASLCWRQNAFDLDTSPLGRCEEAACCANDVR